jgi:hypothetical protein
LASSLRNTRTLDKLLAVVTRLGEGGLPFRRRRGAAIVPNPQPASKFLKRKLVRGRH